MPGAATFLGGIILLASASRPLAMFGAELAARRGAWFALGMVIIPLWPAARTLDPGSRWARPRSSGSLSTSGSTPASAW